MNLLAQSESPNYCPPTDNVRMATFALVGEAPSIQEVREKEPFVGPSGELLNRVLASANIPRYTLYLTNV